MKSWIKERKIRLVIIILLFKKVIIVLTIFIRNLHQMMKKIVVNHQFQRLAIVIKFLKYQIFLYLIKELQKMLQNCEKKPGVLYIINII